jgi:Tol biopolymer transport system component
MGWNRREAGGWAAAVLVAAAASTALAQESARAQEGKGSRYAAPALDTSSEARVLFTETGGVYVMRADGTSVQRVLRGVEAESASWSPDGEQVVFVGDVDLEHGRGGPGIYVVGADGKNLRRLAVTRGHPTRPVWSPGTTLGGSPLIVFSDSAEENEHNYELYAVRPDGTDLRNLTNTPDVRETYPAWSPDAQHIAYVADYERTFEARRSWRRSRVPDTKRVKDVVVSRLVQDASGLVLVEARNVTAVRRGNLEIDARKREPHHFESLTWSPRGTMLAVVVREAPAREQSDVWVVDLERPQDAQNLTRTPEHSESAVSWAPDGSHLLYLRATVECGETSELCLLAMGRKSRTRVLLQATERCPTDWQRTTPSRGGTAVPHGADKVLGTLESPK